MKFVTITIIVGIFCVQTASAASPVDIARIVGATASVAKLVKGVSPKDGSTLAGGIRVDQTVDARHIQAVNSSIATNQIELKESKLGWVQVDQTSNVQDAVLDSANLMVNKLTTDGAVVGFIDIVQSADLRGLNLRSTTMDVNHVSVH